jgi:hypothetical protein
MDVGFASILGSPMISQFGKSDIGETSFPRGFTGDNQI